MTKKEFEGLAEEGLARLPEKFRRKIKNVAFLVEDEPNAETRKEMKLEDGETLLGLYRGVPNTARGADYGVGPTLPDTIVLYQIPTEEEAREQGGDFREAVRAVVADTVWHEVAHYFGWDEEAVARREAERKTIAERTRGVL